MEPSVKKAISGVLRKMRPYVRSMNAVGLKDLSDVTITNSSIYQDEDSISIAVIAYALSKIIERVSFNRPLHWKNFHQHILDGLGYAREHLANNDLQGYRRAIKNLVTTIHQLDTKFALYIQEVVQKAKIKKGTSLYEQGLSVSRTCELLGICNWDLMDYIGKTKIGDSDRNVIGVIDRLKYTRKVFGL